MTSRSATFSQNSHAEPTQGATNADLFMRAIGAAIAKLTLLTKQRQIEVAPLVPT
jgi:hypothetical protein